MSDSILVRVTLDAYDFARPSEKQTQVYVQIPEVARVSYLLPAARFHGLKDRAWPEVLDVAQEHYAQAWVIDPSSAVGRHAVMEWLRDRTNRDEMQVAYEEDQARQNPVVRNLRARIAELEATQGTVYRAAHDVIVMGLYRAAAEARKHCETEARQTEANGAVFHWIEDEEDGVAELVAETTFGEEETGYTVTALEVAAEYDEEADQ